ncbi:MAG: flagellar biosynthesis protein FlhF [Planctomycetota bacterium]
MTIRTYRGKSVQDALAQVKRDLGTDAVIIHTRTIRPTGLFAIAKKPVTEITATTSDVVARARGQKQPAKRAVPRTERRPEPRPAPRARSIEAPLEDRASLVADRFDFKKMTSAPAAIPEPVAAPVDVAQVESPVITMPVPPAPVPTPSHSSDRVDQDSMRAEMDAIKRMVGQVLQSSRGSHHPGATDSLMDCYMQLIESEVAADIADEIIGRVRDELNTHEFNDPQVVQRAVLRRLSAHIPVCKNPPMPGQGADGRPLTIALVGPTGVGKTTTLAKLAATYKLRHGKRVGLITADTYRIAAVDQLRTYADIISLPLKVALTPSEMRIAVESMSDMDVVLVDTAGRSPQDSDRLEELRSFLSAARPHQTHLVLSSTSSRRVLESAVTRFAPLSPDHVILTKLDEAVSFGVLVDIAGKVNASLSFVTTGQEVPDHIEPGNADRLARLVMGGMDYATRAPRAMAGASR